MFYTKNVPIAERVVRFIGGLVLLACGLVGMRGNPAGYLLAGYLLAGSGVVAVLTGFVGFCPLCALAGRRIAKNLEKQREEKP